MFPVFDNRLLPVIRELRYPTRRSFRFHVGSGIAIYKEGLILFERWHSQPLPEFAWTDDFGASLSKAVGANVKSILPWLVIDRVSIHKSGLTGKKLLVSIKTKHGNHFREKIWLHEGKTIVLALRHFLNSSVDINQRTESALHSQTKPISLGKKIFLGLFLMAAPFLIRFLSDGFSRDVLPLGLISWICVPAAELTLFYAYLLGVSLLTASSFDLLNWRHQRSHAARQPYRSKWLGIAAQCTGIFVGCKTRILFPFMIVHQLYAGVAAVLLSLGHRLRQKEGFESIAQDKRLPVLLLRSFDDDQKYCFNPKGRCSVLSGLRPMSGWLDRVAQLPSFNPFRLIRLLFGRKLDTAEEQIAHFFNRIGPVVTCGKPGEALAVGGASRFYLDAATWQGDIIKLLHQSQVIILQPGSTPNVFWELQQCIQQLPPQKLLVSLAVFIENPDAYDSFRIGFVGLTGHQLPASISNNIFIRFEDDWSPVMLQSVTSNPILWPISGCGVDFRLTLWDYLFRLYPQVYAKKPRNLRCLHGAFGRSISVGLWIFVLPLVWGIWNISSIHTLDAEGTKTSGQIRHFSEAPSLVQPTPSAKEVSHSSSRSPASFYYEYKFPPNPGTRFWRQVSATRYAEQSPGGKVDFFKVAGRARNALTDGIIVENEHEDRHQVHIPDFGSPRMYLYFRTKNNNQWSAWKPLGAMKDVRIGR